MFESGGGEGEAASIALPALLSTSARLGLAGASFLGREEFARETDGLPEALRGKYELGGVRGALVVALPFGEGPPEPPDWAARPLPLAGLGTFVRYNWYAELGSRLKAARDAARSALSAAGLEPGAKRDWRYLVNSGLPERPLALAAGLGYLGKSGLLLVGEWGPRVLLGLLLLPFDPSLAAGPAAEPWIRGRKAPDKKAFSPGGACGSCGACVEACPTGAIKAEGGLVPELCLQSWTTRPGALPPAIEAAWGRRLYGCDACTEACPRGHLDRGARTGLGPLGPGLSAARILGASEEELRAHLRGSALGLGWISPAALKRNAALALRGDSGRVFDADRGFPYYHSEEQPMETSNANQYLTFTLDGEQYAIGVSKVREVLEHTRITKLPRTAAFMKGIINLRGAGVPVIDLRLKFGLPETPITKDTSIIVMEVEGLDGRVVVGALADAVQEVVEIEEKAIEPAPRFGTRLSAEFIRGVGKRDESFVILLDIDRIFNAEDISVLAAAEAPAEAAAGAD